MPTKPNPLHPEWLDALKNPTALEPLDASESRFAVAISTAAGDWQSIIHAIQNLLPDAVAPGGFSHSPLARTEVKPK